MGTTSPRGRETASAKLMLALFLLVLSDGFDVVLF